MTNWLLSVLESFDGTDIFSFIGGCIAMVCWKNFQAVRSNRMNNGKRHISLPKLNAKILVWFAIIVVLVGTTWASIETNQSIRETSEQTKAVAIAVCENAKVSGVERKALQDLLLALINSPSQNLPQNSPERKEAGQKIVLTYLGALEDSAAQRKSIQAGHGVDPNFWERYFGPDYPEPNCDPAAFGR